MDAKSGNIMKYEKVLWTLTTIDEHNQIITSIHNTKEDTTSGLHDWITEHWDEEIFESSVDDHTVNGAIELFFERMEAGGYSFRRDKHIVTVDVPIEMSNAYTMVPDEPGEILISENEIRLAASVLLWASQLPLAELANETKTEEAQLKQQLIAIAKKLS